MWECPVHTIPNLAIVIKFSFKHFSELIKNNLSFFKITNYYLQTSNYHQKLWNMSWGVFECQSNPFVINLWIRVVDLLINLNRYFNHKKVFGRKTIDFSLKEDQEQKVIVGSWSKRNRQIGNPRMTATFWTNAWISKDWFENTKICYLSLF